MTKTQAYKDGLAGLPEPEMKTKHVRQLDPIAYVWVEGDVETDASMLNRAAWNKGRKQREVQQWARLRRLSDQPSTF